jgi:hypothetical protein
MPCTASLHFKYCPRLWMPFAHARTRAEIRLNRGNRAPISSPALRTPGDFSLSRPDRTSRRDFELCTRLPELQAQPT